MLGDDRVIGYDARELWLDRRACWGDPWKVDALLRLDVEKPLSIDTTVWGSVFDFLGIAIPAYRGLLARLWEDRERLEAAVAESAAASNSMCLAAFTVAGCDAFPEVQARWAPVIESTSPCKLDSTLAWLGYDVADASTISALVTMRVPSDEPMLRQRFGGSLNRAHLFESLTKAQEFRVYADGAIPVHAPFFVYGVWRLRETR